MIFIAGISIALFISALLLAKKDKSNSDFFLLIWMVANALSLGFYYLQYKGSIFEYPHLLGLQLPLPLLQGVLLYYYVASVTDQAPKEIWKSLLHLIPALLAYAYMISFFFLPAQEKVEIFKNKGGEEYAAFMSILIMSVFLSGIVYVVWCSLLLRKHKKNIRTQFSDIEDINLAWLQFLVLGLGLVWCLVIFFQEDSVIYQGVSIFVILVGFFGVRQKNIFNKTAEANTITSLSSEESDQTAIAPKEKYQSSGLSEEVAEENFQKLNGLMTQGQFYKNASLSLGELAKKLELHPNYISQIINDNGGQTFYDYINTFRVNEFKRLIQLPENKDFTLMSIAYDCGFNSKSSFNRYFKKLTGETPSQFANK